MDRMVGGSRVLDVLFEFLVAEQLATIHDGASLTLVAWATAVVVTSVAAVAFSRTTPPMVGPVLLALFAPAWSTLMAPRLTVLGFTLAALVPVRGRRRTRVRSQSAVFRTIACASVAAILGPPPVPATPSENVAASRPASRIRI